MNPSSARSKPKVLNAEPYYEEADSYEADQPSAFVEEPEAPTSKPTLTSSQAAIMIEEAVGRALAARDDRRPAATAPQPARYTKGGGRQTVMVPPTRCYRCNETDHAVRDCPLPPSHIVCYKCNTAGHISRDCPAPPPSPQSSFLCDYSFVNNHDVNNCPIFKRAAARARANNRPTQSIPGVPLN